MSDNTKGTSTSAKMVLMGEARLMDDNPSKKLHLRLKDNAVTASKIANGAVTSDKIQDKSITRDKLADDALGSLSVKVNNNTLQFE